MCICNVHTLVNYQDSTWMAQGTAHPQELFWYLPAPASDQGSLHQLPAGRLLLSLFYDVHGVSEWQMIPGQRLWQTAAAALVPAGHTKLDSSQLVFFRP